MGIERENCLIPLTALNELHFLWFMRSEPIISGFCEVLKNKIGNRQKDFTKEGRVYAGMKDSQRTGLADEKTRN